jgi:hypothetical protein
VTDPLVAKSLAVRDGVIFAKLRGYPKVIIETDCLELVNLWNNRHGSRSAVELGELVLSFSSFSIQHISRSANTAAHLCAKAACKLLRTSSWLVCNPDFLTVSLLADWSGFVLAE